MRKSDRLGRNTTRAGASVTPGTHFDPRARFHFAGAPPFLAVAQAEGGDGRGASGPGKSGSVLSKFRPEKPDRVRRYLSKAELGVEHKIRGHRCPSIQIG